MAISINWWGACTSPAGVWPWSGYLSAGRCGVHLTGGGKATWFEVARETGDQEGIECDMTEGTEVTRALRALADALSWHELSVHLDEGGPFPLLFIAVPGARAMTEMVLVDGAGRFSFDGGDRTCGVDDVAGAAAIIARFVRERGPGGQRPGWAGRPSRWSGQ